MTEKKISEEGYYPKSTFMFQLLRSLGGAVVYILKQPIIFIQNKKDFGIKEAIRRFYVAEKFYIHQLSFNLFYLILGPFTTTKFRLRINDIQNQDFLNFICEYSPELKNALDSNINKE